MDIKARCQYIYNKYYKFYRIDYGEWIGKTFSTYGHSYFQRYEKMKEVEQQPEDSFEKVRKKFGYDSIDDMITKKTNSSVR